MMSFFSALNKTAATNANCVRFCQVYFTGRAARGGHPKVSRNSPGEEQRRCYNGHPSMASSRLHNPDLQNWQPTNPPGSSIAFSLTPNFWWYMSSVVALGSRSAGKCTKAHRHPFQQHNYRTLCSYDLEQTGIAKRPQGPQKFKRCAPKLVCRASSPESQEQNSPTRETEEVVFYEGSGSNAELLISLLLGTTLVYLPLTLASLGRWGSLTLMISYSECNLEWF